MYFFHGRNTLNDLVYHSSSYFTRVLFDRDSHSGGTPACRDRPRVCPHPDDRGKYVMRSVDRVGVGIGQTRGLSLNAV